MESELIFGIISAISIIVGSVGTVAVQFMRRDKTESEADVNAAQSEKLRADAMDTMYATTAKQAQDMQELMKTQKEYIIDLGTVQREVWALQGENQRQAEREKILTAQVETLMKSNLELKTASVEKDEKIAAMEANNRAMEANNKSLEKKIERWRVGRDNDRARITTLETERAQLVATVDELQRKLENAPEMITDNGKKEAKSGPIQPEITEIEKQKTE